MDHDNEIEAMSSIAKALDVFSDAESATVQRILRWAVARYNVKVSGGLGRDIEVQGEKGAPGGQPGAQAFADFAELYHAASPRTDPERALVGGFWLTGKVEKGEFTSQDVNRLLKDLGHGVGNITDALSALIQRKPSLAMQTSKSGKERQGRKRYKLTRAGVDEAGRMTARDSEGE